MLRDKLKEGETIIAEATMSKAAIILDWALIPSFLLLIFLWICLPILISIYLDVQKVAIIAGALGVDEVNFFDLMANMGVAFRLPKFLIVFFDVMLGLLLTSWFGFSCFKTYLYFGYELIATDSRVLAKARGKELESNWDNVKNVFVEQSLGGRIFGYGNVTVYCRSGALTVKRVTNPLQLKREFLGRLNQTY